MANVTYQLMGAERRTERLEQMVREVYSYNSNLDNVHAYDMEELDEMMAGKSPTDIANMIHFGEFNPMHDRFRFDGYGNLESLTNADYKQELQEYEADIVEAYEELCEYGEGDWELITG